MTAITTRELRARLDVVKVFMGICGCVDEAVMPIVSEKIMTAVHNGSVPDGTYSDSECIMVSLVQRIVNWC